MTLLLLPLTWPSVGCIALFWFFIVLLNLQPLPWCIVELVYQLKRAGVFLPEINFADKETKKWYRRVYNNYQHNRLLDVCILISSSLKVHSAKKKNLFFFRSSFHLSNLIILWIMIHFLLQYSYTRICSVYWFELVSSFLLITWTYCRLSLSNFFKSFFIAPSSKSND